MPEPFDVAIIGGGPGGSTVGGLIKKYRPDWRVLIIEREKFPREHVGESQLPYIGPVLDELGVWDKVEAAEFPVKIGATFRWGKEPELWDFNFIPPDAYLGQTRPAPYEGLRKLTAFQVDRATYDDILLRHAEALGCTVREETSVQSVAKTGDSIDALQLSTGDTVQARWYVDASGNAGILRREMGVEIDCPTELKNVAFWDYWDNAAWADNIGVGGTRIQVISVDFGWLWFIPLGPTRTSLGLVCPATYYKESGKSPEELYVEALAASDRITQLTQGGTRTGEIRSRRDWSYVADRQSGENWFLVGEAAGFADPILSAGLTLTHVGARELAYTLFALDDGSHDPNWLTSHYGDNQRRRVRQHMRFAEFWYAANGQFTDLKDYCQQIAKESGLKLSAKQAWAWLAQGGFSVDILGQASIGGYDLSIVHQLTQRFLNQELTWKASDYNVFELRLEGAEQETLPAYREGKIIGVECLVRNGHHLPILGLYQLVIESLKQSKDIQTIMKIMEATLQKHVSPPEQAAALSYTMQVLEVMVGDGWVKARLDPRKPRLSLISPREGQIVRAHVDLSGKQEE